MWQRLWFATLLFYTAFSAIKANSHESEIIFALDKLLSFTEKHPDELNFDALFGLTLAEAQLNSAYYLNENRTIKDVLLDLTVKSRTSRMLSTRNLANGFSTKRTLQVLLNPKLWERQIVFETGHFRNADSNRFGIDVRSFFEGILHVNDRLFDECLVELLNSDGCSVSSTCKKLIFDDRYPFNQVGYALTHRLLYLQILQRVGGACDWNIESKVWEICSKIYDEVTFIESLGFPKAFDDLLMEELFLCGMNGYADFLDDRFLSTVLASQSKEGCYFVPSVSVSPDRAKKNSNLMHSAKCIDHTTGLAAALLGLFLRYHLDLELINNSLLNQRQ